MFINFLKFWNKRRERFYRRYKWQLVLDFSLITIVLVLIGVFIQLVSFKPILNNFINWPVNNSSSQNNNEGLLALELQAKQIKSIIKFEENLDWEISVKNNGTKDINLVALEFSFSDKFLNIKSISSDADKLEIKDNRLLLKEVKAGQELKLRLSVAWNITAQEYPKSIKTLLKINAQAEDGSRLERLQELGEHKIIASLSLEANLFYHSLQGDQLGIGPIPPQVGIPTKYWLIIKTDNHYNELNNFIFSAQLSEEVDFTDDYSLLAGKFTYDKNRHLLIWKIDQLEAKDKDYLANFSVVLTPRESQIGKNVVVLKNIQYHADDAWTGTTISESLNDLDTSLPADRINRGQGVVIGN